MSPRRETKPPPTSWTWLLLSGVLLLLLVVLGVTTWWRLQRVRELERQALIHQGLILVQSLESATRASMRRGMWRLSILTALVEEMAQHPVVHALAVFSPRGRLLAAAHNRLPGWEHPDLGQDEALVGLPEEVLQAVSHQEPVTRFETHELIVGRPFDPFRYFRRQGQRLPSWACPMDPREWPPPALQGPGVPIRRPPPLTRGYALVRLSTHKLQEAQSQALRQALLLGGLIFLGAGVAALGLWSVGRRRDAEIDRLRREVAEAEHLAAVGRLAGSIAHEVRNPLSALRGLVQYLAKGHPPDSPQAEYAAAAVAEVDRLERVVSGLLDYTRPRTPRRLPVEVGESLASAAALMRDDPRAQGVEINLEVEPSLPSVPADPDQLRQVLVNLLVNALEALDGRGHLWVRAKAEGDMVRVEVADDGPGLPPGDPERLFDPFFSTRQRGTGLGLAIARRMVRAHGGELNASPRPGGGAIFSFTLPLAGGQP